MNSLRLSLNNIENLPQSYIQNHSKNSKTSKFADRKDLKRDFLSPTHQGKFPDQFQKATKSSKSDTLNFDQFLKMKSTDKVLQTEVSPVSKVQRAISPKQVLQSWSNDNQIKNALEYLQTNNNKRPQSNEYMFVKKNSHNIKESKLKKFEQSLNLQIQLKNAKHVSYEKENDPLYQRIKEHKENQILGDRKRQIRRKEENCSTNVSIQNEEAANIVKKNQKTKKEIASKSITSYKGVIEELSQKLKSFEETIESLKDRQNQSSKDNDFTIQNQEQKIIEVEQKLNQQTEENKFLKKTLNLQNTQIQDYLVEIQRLKAEKNQTPQQQNECNDNQDDEIQQKNQKIENLEQMLQKMNENQLEMIQNNEKQLQEQQKNFQNENNLLRSQMSILEKRNFDLELRLGDFCKEKEKLQEEYTQRLKDLEEGYKHEISNIFGKQNQDTQSSPQSMKSQDFPKIQIISDFKQDDLQSNNTELASEFNQSVDQPLSNSQVQDSEFRNFMKNNSQFLSQNNTQSIDQLSLPKDHASVISGTTSKRSKEEIRSQYKKVQKVGNNIANLMGLKRDYHGLNKGLEASMQSIEDH